MGILEKKAETRFWASVKKNYLIHLSVILMIIFSSLNGYILIFNKDRLLIVID